MGTPVPDKDNHISCRWDKSEQRYITLAEDWQRRSKEMQKFNVWVDLPGEKEGETVEEFVGIFEGYIGEIATATLMLHPRALSLLIAPPDDE